MIHRKFSIQRYGLRSAWLLLATVLFSANALAAESDNVKARFNVYWNAYASGNYLAAAQLVHPDDLAGVQKEILPVFILGLKNSDPEIKQLAAAFFNGVPDGKRETLTGVEAMARLMSLVTLASPDILNFIKKSRMEVSAVTFDEKSPNDAVIKYSLVVADTSQADFERLSKLNDSWFLRTKEKPSATAAKFRAIFEKK